MKALLICPGSRPAVTHLAEHAPLALAPLLGRTLLEYWLEDVAGRGAREVLIVASDRPDQVRAVAGDGARWGLKIQLQTTHREFSLEEARARFGPEGCADWLPDGVRVMDTLPGLPDRRIFDSYAAWFAALQTWMPRAVTSTRIGVHEIRPGVWVGLHARIAPDAQLHAPCWIGEHAVIGAGVTVGPDAIVEDRAVIDHHARIRNSAVGPETFVGPHIVLERSLVQGATVLNWKTDSCLQVPDAFLLCSLDRRRFAIPHTGITARVLAALAMIVTSPLAVVAMFLALVRGHSPLELRLGVRPQRSTRRDLLETFAYYELAGAGHWLRRWPQFWKVVRGEFTWFGNRPLRPTQALGLANDFERLWLAAPVGLVSLADAHGCSSAVDHEACAHAAYLAVHADAKLRWFIFSRSLRHVIGVWPLRAPRQRDAVRLPQLLPEREV